MSKHPIGPNLDVFTWNTHNERAAAAHVRNMAFDIGAVHEAAKRVRSYNRMPEHDYWTGEPGRPEDLRRSTGILAPKGHEVRGHTVEKMSDSVEAEALWRVGKERHGHAVVIDLLGMETAVVAAHPVAGPEALAGYDADKAIVKKYADFRAWLADQFEYHHRLRKRQVIFLSDVQVTENNQRPWSPRLLFEDHRMDWHWVKIDVIAWTKGFKSLQTSAKEEGLPSDHPLLRVRLTRSGT